MQHVTLAGLCLVSSILLAACGGSNESAAGAPTAQRQTLTASGDCTFASCGVVPSSLGSAARVDCKATADSCSWSDAASSTSVSYRPCAASECPTRPAVDCPSSTVQTSQQCGSENDAACAWTTFCVPPRITTPCPDAHGCDGVPVPSIGIICNDGSNGGFTCVADGNSCRLERNCD